jgi:hypothetical protein
MTVSLNSTPVSTMDDLRSALAKARDVFLESEHGWDLCDNRNLPPTPHSQYLRNRLEVAFIAGWDARNADDSLEHPK